MSYVASRSFDAPVTPTTSMRPLCRLEMNVSRSPEDCTTFCPLYWAIALPSS